MVTTRHLFSLVFTSSALEALIEAVVSYNAISLVETVGRKCGVTGEA